MSTTKKKRKTATTNGTRAGQARVAADTPAAILLTDNIADRLCRLADAMIMLSARSIKRRWGIRHTDLRLLNLLEEGKSLSVRELSRRAYVDQAWVSRSLRKLETDGFIKRASDAHDSRLSLISLTRKGEKVLDEIRPYSDRSEQVLLDGIDERKLKRQLDRLDRNAAAMLEFFKESEEQGDDVLPDPETLVLE